jgi:hypothetical protein
VYVELFFMSSIFRNIKDWITRHPFISLFLAAVILGAFHSGLTVLVGCLFFCAILTAVVVAQIIEYCRLRSGDFVQGVVKEMEEIPSEGDDDDYHQAVVEFSLTDGSLFTIDRRFSLIEDTKQGELVKVWVNEEKPEASAVLPKCDYFWWFGFAGLCIMMLVMYGSTGYIIWKYFMPGGSPGMDS